ncbi:MAG TPA: sulfotransferase [Nitrospirae bacterium]|nr:hypothetical protein BMS3Abin06_01167 [bacterium BMS3Abin06]HDH13607.1 sulfotransferase [Nitrospirota bacterium]HDZ01187.1 sulfotransferase [Nitrospirota bacterium]
MEFERREEHKRNEKLEEILKDINGMLAPVESQSIQSFKKNKYPIVLIMGSPRSGTTLLLQWLASSGYFCYPTNMLSRFYEFPYIGSKIQLMLTKYDFNNEIFDFKEEIPFDSNLGKTKGALAPNEFWYFWRRFFHFGEIQQLNEEELASIDHQKFVSELAAIEAVFDKPFSMKGLIVNWNIPFITSIVEKVLFIYIKRHPFYNIQSLLNARINYYDDIKAWYSFKPPEYVDLKNCSPYEQVAGQVYFTNRAIEEGLARVEDAKVLEIAYEEFCQSPDLVFKQIINKFKLQGYQADWPYKGPARFSNTNKISLSCEEQEKVMNAYRHFSGETLTL